VLPLEGLKPPTKLTLRVPARLAEPDTANWLYCVPALSPPMAIFSVAPLPWVKFPLTASVPADPPPTESVPLLVRAALIVPVALTVAPVLMVTPPVVEMVPARVEAEVLLRKVSEPAPLMVEVLPRVEPPSWRTAPLATVILPLLVRSGCCPSSPCRCRSCAGCRRW
jgi:hypothetical protein